MRRGFGFVHIRCAVGRSTTSLLADRIINVYWFRSESNFVFSAVNETRSTSDTRVKKRNYFSTDSIDNRFDKMRHLRTFEWSYLVPPFRPILRMETSIVNINKYWYIYIDILRGISRLVFIEFSEHSLLTPCSLPSTLDSRERLTRFKVDK